MQEGTQLGVVGHGCLVELAGDHLQRALQFDDAP